MVGGAESVVTPEPPQAVEREGEAGEGCRDDEGGAAQPPPTSRARRGDVGAEDPADGRQGVGGRPVGRLRGAASSCTPPALRSDVSLGSSLPFEVRRGGVDEALAAGGVDQDVAVGVLDVVGERLARAPVRLGRLLLGDDLVLDAERLPERGDLGAACRSRGPSRPRTPSGRRPGGPPCRGRGPPWPRRRPPGCASPAARRSCCNEMKAPVTSGHSSWQRERNGARTTTLPRSAARDTACPCWLTSGTCCGVGRSRTSPWSGGGAAGADGPAGGQEHAEGEQHDGDEGPAGSGAGQSSSSPAGRKVKGRSAREMSVEAIQRVRSSKTGAMVDGSSSCCSLKRTEPS